jgi:hypothetical protein
VVGLGPVARLGLIPPVVTGYQVRQGFFRIRRASGLVHPSALVPDFDCLTALDVAHDPSRFEHNPRVCVRRVRLAALRDLHAVNEHENVAVFIPVNLAVFPSSVEL